MEFTDEMRNTQERLTRHKALPFLQRVLKRITRDYPERTAREEVRRYELGSWGRIKEDLSEAVHLSRKISISTGDFAHRRIRMVAGGNLSIWPLSQDPGLSTVVDRTAASVQSAQKLWSLDHATELPGVDGVAFELKVGDTIFPNDIHRARLLLVSDRDSVGSIDFDNEGVDLMSQEAQDLAEQLAASSLYETALQHDQYDPYN